MADQAERQSRTLFARNISFQADENDFRAIPAFQNAVEIKMPVDKETGRPRGFGFIEYASVEECQAALQQLQQQGPLEFNGRECYVNLSQPTKSGGQNNGFRGGRGGGYRGGGGRGRGGYNNGGGYNSAPPNGSFGGGNGFQNGNGYGGGYAGQAGYNQSFPAFGGYDQSAAVAPQNGFGQSIGHFGQPQQQQQQQQQAPNGYHQQQQNGGGNPYGQAAPPQAYGGYQ